MTENPAELPEVSEPKTIGHARNPAGATFGPRDMGDFELVWMTDGGCVYVEDGVEHDVPEGGVVLCRRGRRDAFRWDTRRASRHAFTHFDVTRHRDAAMAGPSVVVPAEGDVLRTGFRHLLTWAGRGDPRLRRGLLRAMLWSFLLGETDAHATPSDDLPDAVREVLAWLPGALDRGADVSLAALAGVACVTPEHLCRLFKRSTGRTPAATVRAARLDRAADLLRRSNLPVARVAEAAGFASAFHFSRRFSEAFDVSPTGYRRRVRAGEVPPLPLLHDGQRHRRGEQDIKNRHGTASPVDGQDRQRWT